MASRRQHPRRQTERNAELLDRLLRRHRGRLLRQARFHSERPQDAEDALGDACVRFLLRFDGEGVEEARRWMLVVVRRCAWAIPRRRRERRRLAQEVPIGRLDPGVDIGGPAPACARSLEAAEELAVLAGALGELGAEERRALLLLALGYSYAEIAAIEGWTYTKVKRHAYEGRRRLRRILAEGGEDR